MQHHSCLDCRFGINQGVVFLTRLLASQESVWSLIMNSITITTKDLEQQLNKWTIVQPITMLASEQVLARDWNSPVEDEAWKDL